MIGFGASSLVAHADGPSPPSPSPSSPSEGTTSPEAPYRRKSLRPKAVVIGGGCAGAMLCSQIEHIVDVTLIDKKDFFEFTPALKSILLTDTVDLGAPGDPIGEETKETLRQNFVLHRYYLNKTDIVVDSAAVVTPTHVVTKGGKRLQYDYVFFCMGSEYMLPFKQSEQKNLPDRVEELRRYKAMLATKKRVACIGGGSVGVETAAALAGPQSCLPKDKEVVLLHSRQHLLPNHGAKICRYAENNLSKKSVDVKTLSRVSNVVYDPQNKTFSVQFDYANHQGQPIYTGLGGTEENLDWVMDCRGLRPNTAILQKHFSKNLDPQGFVEVNANCQLKGHPNCFALGDLCRQPSDLGHVNTLAYVVDNVASVANIFKRALRHSESTLNGCYDLGYPLELVYLGPWQSCGSSPVAGQLRSYVAAAASRSIHASFLDTFQYPNFARNVPSSMNMHLNTWLEKAETDATEFSYFSEAESRKKALHDGIAEEKVAVEENVVKILEGLRKAQAEAQARSS